MAVTEFVTISLKKGYTLLSEPLPQLFQLASKRQFEWSSFPLLYFTDPEDPPKIYLISGWNSVAAQQEWIKSEGNQELLTLTAPYIEDITLHHLDIDFNAIPSTAAVVVYRRFSEGFNRDDLELLDEQRKEGVWEGHGKDLENPGTGTHQLVVYPAHPLLDNADIARAWAGQTHIVTVMFRSFVAA